MEKNKLISKYRDAEIAHIPNIETYKKIYNQSIKYPEDFWGTQAKRLDWYDQWKKVANNNFTTAQIKWFEGGILNATYNCLDRHIEKGFGKQTAIIWEGNNPSEDATYTYLELLTHVCRFSNVLKSFLGFNAALVLSPLPFALIK